MFEAIFQGSMSMPSWSFSCATKTSDVFCLFGLFYLLESCGTMSFIYVGLSKFMIKRCL